MVPGYVLIEIPKRQRTVARCGVQGGYFDAAPRLLQFSALQRNEVYNLLNFRLCDDDPPTAVRSTDHAVLITKTVFRDYSSTELLLDSSGSTGDGVF